MANKGQQDQHQPRAPSPVAAPDRDEMDRIRARRLQRLEGSSAISASSQPTPSLASPTPTPRNTQSPAPSSSRPPAPAPAPAPTPSRLAPDDSLRPHKSVRRPEPIDDFTDNYLARVFRISVNPTKTVDVNGHNLHFLDSSSAELEESGVPLKLTLGNLDQYIFEWGASIPHSRSLFAALLHCYQRASEFLGTMSRASRERQNVAREAKRLAVSHCIFSLTLPDLYGRERPDNLAPHLLSNYGTEQESVPFDLIGEFVNRREDEDGIIPLLVKAMISLSVDLAQKNMASRDHIGYFNALKLYANFPVLLQAISADPSFNSPCAAEDIEKKTFLGPFFCLSPLHFDDALIYYPNPTQLDQSSVGPGNESARADIEALWNQLYEVVNAFVRAGEKPRSSVLSWFAYVLNNNHKRTATYPNRKALSSDAFMLNVSVVLDRLCEPFMDSTFSKVDRIQTEYFRRNPRIEIGDETKLFAEEQASKEFYQETLLGTCNFITEVFFLSLAAHCYGPETLHNTIKHLDYEIKLVVTELEKVEKMRDAMPVPARARADEVYQRFTSLLKRYKALRMAMASIMANERMQSLSLRFMRYVAVWLLRLAGGSDYIPGREMKLPLPEHAPAAFACLPEYAASVILNNIRYAFDRVPQLCISSFGDEIFIFCITFLQAKGYIKNPQTKTNLVHVLRLGTLPIYSKQRGIWGDLLLEHDFSQEFLLRSLMEFYIGKPIHRTVACQHLTVRPESEATISFYDKFNVRFLIFEVIKAVWSNDRYKEQLSRESKHNRKFFVHFVKLVLNDATYVLDEALSRFPKIHELEVELRNHGAELSQEDREKKEKTLKSLESQAHGYMQLTNNIMYMMELFTAAMKEAFLMPEIVERLAAMLDYNIQVLTGPKNKTLRTENMYKYEFNPRTLLGQFVEVYLCLGTSRAFVEAVANDGRSYSPEMMDSATRVLEKTNVKSPKQMGQWYALIAKFREAREAAEQAELDLGEVPTEFEDPLLSHLMKDPVVLPSNNIVDRQTITEHLLTSAMDPFTRQAMSIEDVVPATEMKERIERWKEERIAEARARLAASREATAAGDGDSVDDEDTMDTNQ